MRVWLIGGMGNRGQIPHLSSLELYDKLKLELPQFLGNSTTKGIYLLPLLISHNTYTNKNEHHRETTFPGPEHRRSKTNRLELERFLWI